MYPNSSETLLQVQNSLRLMLTVLLIRAWIGGQ